MKDDASTISALLGERLRLLDSLAVELRACSEAMVALDLDGMQRRVAQQEQVCQQIRSVDREIDCLQRQWSVEERGELLPAVKDILGRISSAQSEVRRLNSAHAALLRRSRRTLRAMMNFVNFYGGRYEAVQNDVVTPTPTELARV
ncbi:MAG TPA: flagellar export chaperone FlgN [Candidatus Baltobacteraceae bacterium]|nr:flagellar export chaperone FlgN [Candidatus Baltobacteraceae bacterium]